MANTRKPVPLLYVGIITFGLGLFVATLLQSGALGGKGTPEASGTEAPLFELDGQAYQAGDLPFQQASELHQLTSQVAERRQEILRRAAFELHIDKMAAEQGQDRDAVLADLLQVEAPAEEDINQFYRANQQRIGRPLHEVKALISDALVQEKQNAVRSELIGWLEKEGRLTLDREAGVSAAPEARFDLSGAPAIGSADPLVTIVEFADYRCGHCKRASATLKNIIEAHAQEVRWVMLDFPVLGGLSRSLAEAAYCANQQSRFWDFHHAVFEQQDSLNESSAVDIARSLPLDPEAFESCLGSEAASGFVAQSEAQGLDLGVRGTPAIFINGRKYSGGNLEGDLQRAVRQEISRRNAEGGAVSANSGQ